MDRCKRSKAREEWRAFDSSDVLWTGARSTCSNTPRDQKQDKQTHLLVVMFDGRVQGKLDQMLQEINNERERRRTFDSSDVRWAGARSTWFNSPIDRRWEREGRYLVALFESDNVPWMGPISTWSKSKRSKQRYGEHLVMAMCQELCYRSQEQMQRQLPSAQLTLYSVQLRLSGVKQDLYTWIHCTFNVYKQGTNITWWQTYKQTAAIMQAFPSGQWVCYLQFTSLLRG